jgi:hypothetical protein
MTLTRALAIVGMAFALAGCGDAGRDLAECTLKALPTTDAETVERGEYLYNCMAAAGYKLGPTCQRAVGLTGYRAVAIEVDSCWYPDNWWER